MELEILPHGSGLTYSNSWDDVIGLGRHYETLCPKCPRRPVDSNVEEVRVGPSEDSMVYIGHAVPTDLYYITNQSTMMHTKSSLCSMSRYVSSK